MATALVVGDLRVVRTATTRKAFVALRPSAIRLKILDCRLAWNERGFFRHQVWSERAPGGNVVDDPDATAMSGQNKITLARVDDNIAHRHGRKVRAFVLRPALSTIDGNPKSEFSTEKEQVRINCILGDDVRKTAHPTGLHAQRSPAFAVVGGLVGVWFLIAEGVAVESGIRSALFKAA